MSCRGSLDQKKFKNNKNRKIKLGKKAVTMVDIDIYIILFVLSLFAVAYISFT